MRPDQYAENESLKARIADMARIPDHIRDMSAEELDAELARHKGARAQVPATLRPADRRQALVHAMREGLGVPVVAAHPAVSDMRDDLGRVDLIEAAAFALQAQGRTLPMSGDGFAVMASAFATDDLPDALREAVAAYVRARPSEHLETLRAVTRRVDAKDYRPIVWSFAGLEQLPIPGANTSATYNTLKPRLSAEALQLYTSTDLVLISRQRLVDDAFATIGAIVQSYTNAALYRQVGMLASLLEGATTLQDGNAWFADGVNSVTAALDATGLGSVAAMLRKQPLENGDQVDVRAAVLLVPETHEIAALALMETLPADRRLQVVATARLAGSHWYAMADPSAHPVIARVLSTGASDTGVSFAGLRAADVYDANEGRDVSFNGLGLDAWHTVGIGAMSRTGIVRAAFSG